MLVWVMIIRVILHLIASKQSHLWPPSFVHPLPSSSPLSSSITHLCSSAYVVGLDARLMKSQLSNLTHLGSSYMRLSRDLMSADRCFGNITSSHHHDLVRAFLIRIHVQLHAFLLQFSRLSSTRMILRIFYLCFVIFYVWIHFLFCGFMQFYYIMWYFFINYSYIFV